MTEGIIEIVFGNCKAELIDAGIQAQVMGYEFDQKVIEAQLKILETLERELIEDIKETFPITKPFIHVYNAKMVQERLLGGNIN